MSGLAGLRVLVIGINYAPEHTGIAPYTTRACEHFNDRGAEVLVLAGVPHYPHWSIPALYRRRRRVDEDRNGVRVRRLRHHVPQRQSAVRRALYEATFGTHALLDRLPWRPDVVLAVVPSLFGAAAAAVIARRHRARLIVWVQDLMGAATAQSGIAGGSRVTAATSFLEGLVLRQADEVLVLNDAFQRTVEAMGVPGHRIRIARNWTHVAAPRSERQHVRDRLGWSDDEVIALHSGNMGLKQGLENVVEAAKCAAELAPHVRFVLMGDGSQREALQEMADGIPTLTFLPPVSDDEFTDVLAAADVLLVNERASAVDMSLPSKLTSYFQAGVPVIAAVPGLGGTAGEVSRSGAGRVVTPEDARKLLDGVLGIVEDVNLIQTFRLAAGAYVREHLSAQAGLDRLEESLCRGAGRARGDDSVGVAA